MTMNQALKEVVREIAYASKNQMIHAHVNLEALRIVLELAKRQMEVPHV